MFGHLKEGRLVYFLRESELEFLLMEELTELARNVVILPHALVKCRLHKVVDVLRHVSLHEGQLLLHRLECASNVCSRLYLPFTALF